ncbi:MAG TPA: alanine--tRNA ligase [Gammaproteobacteria bacterium]|nr:alanine--tRNA ligase [Gammaproteobacteria bacterium]
MSKVSSAALRTRFLDYFRRNGHEIVPSSPLVPANDPTLLFTNAGMVQFKEVFLGLESRPYRRAASAQRCVRAGGKHNDLENVGYTARHHTFFEMLGNFSFGDYFKREAIHYAWEFLTRELAIPAERLWITVFEEDDEAADIWLREIGVDPVRFARIGAEDNFWSMGDTGPCGPCSEIFYDHGPGVAGGPPGTPEADGDRYVEIWNLVFMQYNRDASGTMTPLPKPSVDTGMGLERLAAVMQGVHSNYDIDLFRNLIRAAARLAGRDDLDHPSLRVIADHIRSSAFLVVDGVIPSNEGRGYVLRRIIRRAIRHGYQLGIKEPFFHRLVQPLVDEMGEAYPELPRAQAQVERVLRQEEERFAETLEQGMHILEQAIAGLRGKVIPGETVFRLYDTYGFPVDLTADIARERGLTLDMAGFEREMAAQRERARAAGRFSVDYGSRPAVAEGSEFTGYEHLAEHSRVIALLRGGEAVERLAAGEEGAIALDRTPFYAEAGGQVGDRGVLRAGDAVFEVRDTQKSGEAILHLGRVVRGAFRAGDTVEAEVDQAARQATACNHSATHLLHAALRRVLGEHVVQKGSLVEPARLRFDYAHFEAPTPAQLAEIEALVNAQIRANLPVETVVTSFDAAREMGAMALFGEKYGDQVRVLKMGAFSMELCGGTHVRRTGDIGLFKIVSEGGIAAGVRRIEAVTGEAALARIQDMERTLGEAAALLKTTPDKLSDRLGQLLAHNRELEKTVDTLKAKLASSVGSDLAARAVDVAGCKVLAARLEGADVKTLRNTLDQLKSRLGSAAVVLAAVDGDKISLVAGVTGDLTDRLKAGDLLNFVARQVGGKGGGRPEMAQGGGNDPAALPAALAGVPGWVRERLEGREG